MGARRVPFLIAAVGVLLTAVLAGEALALIRAGELGPLFLVSVLTTAPFLAACIGGAVWLVRSDLPADRYPRVGAWAVSGLVFFLGLNALTILATDPMALAFVVGWLRWAAALGAGTGVVIGIIEARAIHRAVAAERARIRADEAETREELLTYLHDLLRHKVRNAVNAIDGHAELLANGAADDRSHLESIRNQTDELHQITREVRTFLEVSGTEDSHHVLDLCTLVRDEFATLEETFETVELELDCDSEVFVEGNELMSRAFRNLLVNSTLHDPDEVRSIHVAISAEDESATVSIADDGSGISGASAGDLFDLNRGGTPEQGLGLPLGRLLFERYGGEVRLEETGPDGTTLVVELPRVDRPDTTTDAVAPATADGGNRMGGY
jgi:two-component system OmpR family sensor kinase